MGENILTIQEDNITYAIIIKKDYEKNGIEFFTPDCFSQQLGYMNRPKGYEIQPHLHLMVKREVSYTLEFLYLRKGKVQVDFYRQDQTYLKSELLVAGDCILLTSGGHGFQMLEDSELIEVKQGPYINEEMDKIKFTKSSEELATYLN